MMKVCISSYGQDKTSLMDSRFGRCPYFVLYDTEADKYSAVANKGINASGGAGIAAAQTAIDSKADTVLTGNIGPNAMELLQANGIRTYQTTDRTVEEAVASFLNTEKTEILRPTPAHFGMGGHGRRGW